MNYKQMGEA